MLDRRTLATPGPCGSSAHATDVSTLPYETLCSSFVLCLRLHFFAISKLNLSTSFPPGGPAAFAVGQFNFESARQW